MDRAKQIRWLFIVGGYWLLQFFYVVSPVDAIPDVAPVFGQMDDGASLLSAVLLTGWAFFTRRLSGKAKAPTSK